MLAKRQSQRGLKPSVSGWVHCKRKSFLCCFIGKFSATERLCLDHLPVSVPNSPYFKCCNPSFISWLEQTELSCWCVSALGRLEKNLLEAASSVKSGLPELVPWLFHCLMPSLLLSLLATALCRDPWSRLVENRVRLCSSCLPPWYTWLRMFRPWLVISSGGAFGLQTSFLLSLCAEVLNGFLVTRRYKASDGREVLTLWCVCYPELNAEMTVILVHHNCTDQAQIVSLLLF